MAPPPLKNRPELKPWDMAYLKAFDLAAAGRQQGFSGPNAVPASEFMKTLGIVGLTGDWESDLEMVQSLDAVTLNYYAEKSKAESPAK